MMAGLLQNLWEKPSGKQVIPKQQIRKPLKFYIMPNYTGQGDVNLYLAEQTSLMEENDIKRQFSVEIVNTTGLKKVIALCPGFISPLGLNTETVTVTAEDGTSTVDVLKSASLSFQNAQRLQTEGYSVDFILNDGVLLDNGTGTLEASSPDGEIKSFLDYARYNPQRVVNFDVSVNDKTVFPKNLSVARLRPDYSVAIKKIPISKYFDPDQSQSTKVNVPIDMQFDSQNLIFFELPGLQNGVMQTSIEFNFNLGASHEYGTAIINKAGIAKSGTSSF